MNNKDINQNLNRLYTRMNKRRGIFLWAIIYLPFMLRVNLKASWFFVVAIILAFLAATAIFFYQRSILEKAIAVKEDLPALDKQVQLFKRWKNNGLYICCPLFIGFLIWFFVETPGTVISTYFLWGMLTGLFVETILAIFHQRTINKELEQISSSIHAQMNP